MIRQRSTPAKDRAMRHFPFTRVGQFLLFLITPEDSSPGGFREKRQDLAVFDNRLGGVVKIAFWIMVVVVFWSALPLLSCLFCD